jgi:cell division protein FtsI/penicillin-binding protein 2
MKAKSVVIFVLASLIVVFVLLACRFFFLQHYRINQFRQSSQIQQYSVVSEKPCRGAILDRRGRILAASNKVETVFVEPRLLPSHGDTKEVANQLQQILDCPANEICGIIYESGNPGFVKIAEEITSGQRDKIIEATIPSVGIQSNWKRCYPMGRLTCHVVGFVGAEQIGFAGIEQKYNSQLCGSDGSDVFFIDAARRPIGFDPTDSKIVEDGADLALTIDATIQQFARQALLNQFEAYEAESAVAIVMNPWTGAVLALVSLPDFDPVCFSSTSPNTLRNRAVIDPFEPGSIFKPIVASLALDFEAVGYDEKIFCEDGYYAAYRIGEYGNRKYGRMTIRQILVNSSNIGMAKIGLKMQKQKLYEGVRLFGFGARTGIDLPAEDPGLLKPVREWSGYTPTRIPFGHEISVTAIQIVRAYCILANGGRTVRPHLVRVKIESNENVVESQPPSNLPAYVIKPATANWIIREALVGVVNEGTGKKAAIEGVRVFGKTGTANIAGTSQRGYDETNYVASFVGGAPADRPEVIILVSIRKPNKALGKGYTGGTVAAPVFREILKKTLTYLRQD